MWLCQQGKTGGIYNLVDGNNTKQGDITNIVSDIFNINHDYWGNTLSNIAKVSDIIVVPNLEIGTTQRVLKSIPET